MFLNFPWESFRNDELYNLNKETHEVLMLMSVPES